MLNNQLTRPLIFGPNVNCIKVGEVEPTGSPKGIIIGYGATAVIYGQLYRNHLLRQSNVQYIF